MANYGWDDLDVGWDDGGGNDSIKAYLDELSIDKVKAMIEEWIAVGDTWAGAKDSGSRRWDSAFELGGLYDDTGDPAPNESFLGSSAANLGSSGTLLITLGGSKTISQPCLVEDYSWEPSSEKLTRWKTTLRQNGAPTFA